MSIPSPAPLDPIGTDLTKSDLTKLGQSWITPELAQQARLRRVTSMQGGGIVSRNGAGDYAGILFPYVWPGEQYARDYRLRRDHPELEYAKDGKPREKNKYLSPPRRSNLLYFVPGTQPAWLEYSDLPIAITEGEKKTLALWRLAHYEELFPRFLPVGLPGVWNFRGTIGKADGPNGDRRDVKGVIPDIERILWLGRQVFIVFDCNVQTNESVEAARVQLSNELRRRGAEVLWVELPQVGGVNGVDDLIALQGPDAVLLLFKSARPSKQKFQTTDYGNAERLVSRHGINLHFCHPWRKWLYWTGQRWSIDASAQVVRMAKSVVRGINREAADVHEDAERQAINKWARESERSTRIDAMIRLAESEDVITVAPECLDASHWILNCANGTIDLSTGERREHRRDDLITKLASVEHRPSSKCPRWLRFLEEVFEPHQDLVPFIQRAVGYSLTGDTREECLFLLYGTGRNGKGTLIKTLSTMLGDYAGTADFSAFTAKRDEGPRDDVANMRGKHFISAQESREGAALAESLIKWLTGGDRVRARRLYENSYEFDPTHKIWLATNHKPRITGTDPAIWSRIKLIPFDVSFEGKEDRELKSALLGELPGILNWAIEGCSAWRREGLAFPESVLAATHEYRAESDQIARFIDELCVVGNQFRSQARHLFTGYRKWAEDGGEQTIQETAFGRRLAADGYTKEHTARGNVYLGIALRG